MTSVTDLPAILCYGDSNTYGADGATGGRHPWPVRWPGVLAAALEGRARVIEEGLGGRTTCWEDPFSEGRSGRALLRPILESHAPLAIVVIMLGTNDLKTYFRLDAQTIAAGAATLVDMVRTSGTGPGGGPPRVLLVSPPRAAPTVDRALLWGFDGAAERSADFGRFFRSAAAETGAFFLDAAAIVDPDPADGIHLDAAAHAALGRAIAEAVESLL